MNDEPNETVQDAEFEPAELPQFEIPAIAADSLNHQLDGANLEPVHKVLVRVQAVLGQTKLNVGDLMRMGAGDVIDLDKRVGEPVDVWVNNRLIARGEVVLTGGLLGVALTEMVKQTRG